MRQHNDIAVIFCDQIRFETSGQFSAIGVWPPLVEVEEYPFTAELALLVLWKDMPSDATVSLALRSGSGAEFGKATFPVKAPPAEAHGLHSFLPLPPRRITLSSADTIEVVVAVDGAEPEVVGLMRVIDEPSEGEA